MIAFHLVELHCDFPVGGGRICGEVFEDLPIFRYLSAPEMRKEASKHGWTSVPNGRGGDVDADYCPEHKPPAGDRAVLAGALTT